MSDLREKVARAIRAAGMFTIKEDFGPETVPIAFVEADAAIATVLRDMREWDDFSSSVDTDLKSRISRYASENGINLDGEE